MKTSKATRLASRASIVHVALTLGCGDLSFVDTEGQRYVADCSSTPCRVERVVRDRKVAADVQKNGKYVTICDPQGSPFSCRPVACEDGALCARLGGSEFSCERGRCVADTRPMAPEDKVTACLAGTGSFVNSARQMERITLARACEGSCTLPAACEGP
jgi:hypothetical protein